MSTLDNLIASIQDGKDIPAGTKQETITRAIDHVNTQKIFGDINQSDYKKIMEQLQSFQTGGRRNTRRNRRSRRYKNKR